MSRVAAQAASAKKAAPALYNATTARKNAVLRAIAAGLKKDAAGILAANRQDVAAATRAGVPPVLIDRLTLDDRRLRQLIAGLGEVVRLPDSVGRCFDRRTRPNGLVIEKMRVPLGTVGIIYEARPNVTVEAAALCLKSGNSVVLRGGSEALRTNRRLAAVVRRALRASGLPAGAVEFIDTPDRAAVLELLKQDDCLDVIIPRGGQALIRFIRENATVPIIAHGEGNCHIYVDRSADLGMAAEIVFNAKVQRPSVCNAAEKLLVHAGIARRFLPLVAGRLRPAGVEIRADARARAHLPGARPAVKADWAREYLDLILAVRVVDSLEAAIRHINRCGSHHSDAIVTGRAAAGRRFLREVDSAAVYVNASTRFTDGFEFGLGAEIGISTQKLHARGPMGLEELTSVKFVVSGGGQVRK